MSPGSSTPFKRIGSAVYRRRKIVVLAWILALILVVPVALQVGNVTSLQQGSASGNQLESVKASDLISAQFSGTVPNSTLLIVVTANNVSSEETQGLIRHLVASLKSDANIQGLNQTSEVYSNLYTTIRGTNTATFSSLDGANGTVRLLLGIPAAYVNTWGQVFSSTHN